MEDEINVVLIVANIVASILDRIVSSKIGLNFEFDLDDFR
jgi:hypothetical protein